MDLPRYYASFPTSAVSLTRYEDLFAQMLEDVYNKKISPDLLSQNFIKTNYKDLLSQNKEGYGNTFEALSKTGYPDTTVLKMKENLFKFSGAKNYTMLSDLNEMLYKDGQKLSYNQFKEKALAVNQAYIQNYLQAEWQTASQAGEMANNWKAFQKNKELYPNLKYKTQGDKKVRKDHQELEGIIAPLDSVFWQRHYPPNGWRCRCYVVQTAEPVSDNIPESAPGIKPEFIGNVGISGQVFTENPLKGAKPHPYFTVAKKAEIEGKIKNLHFKFLQEEALEKLKGKVITNKHSKLPVEFSKSSLKHAFNKNKDDYEDKNQIIYYLDSILEQATYLGITPPYHNDRNELGTHIYLIEIKGKNNYALVREFTNGSMLFYSISDSDKVLEGLEK